MAMSMVVVFLVNGGGRIRPHCGHDHFIGLEPVLSKGRESRPSAKQEGSQASQQAAKQAT